MSKRILIVEDDPHGRLALKSLVTHLGYVVYCAADGQQALALADDVDFDGILLDAILPDISGLEVLHRLRGRHPTIPILITSGHKRDALEAYVGGAEAYLMKPLDVESLKAAMQRWFGSPS